MSDTNTSRRKFLVVAATAAVVAPFLAPSTSRAADLPPLPLDNPTAVALAYAEDASVVKHPAYKAGSMCGNCQFYTAAAGAERGPCTLFPGFSVPGKAWCSAWAKKA